MAVYGIVLLSLLGAVLLGFGVTCAVFASDHPFEPGDWSIDWGDNTPYEPSCYGFGWGYSSCDDVEDDWSDDVDDGLDGVDFVDGADSTDGWAQLIQCSVQPASLNFGLVAVGESATRELTLSCSSLVDVAPIEFVPSLEFPDSVVGVSTVVVGSVTEVPGDVAVTVAVTWTPGASVVADPFGELLIGFSGEFYDGYGDETEFHAVDLRGKTPAPELVLTETSLDFGGARPGESVTKTLTMSNEGDAALDVSGVAIDDAESDEADSSWALAWEPVAVIEPGESTDLTVTFTHPEPGQPVGLSSRDVVITSNDPQGHSWGVPVKAYYWSKERCALSVPGPVVFPASAIPSRELIPVDVTLKNDGDGPCTSVQIALLAGTPAHGALALPAACDEAGAAAFEVVFAAPSTSLAPGESTTLATQFRAPSAAGSVIVPVGVIGLARDPGMPTWDESTEVQASALLDGLCPSAVTVTSAAAGILVPEGAWTLQDAPEGCSTRHVARIGGAGSVCSAALSAGCAEALTLSTVLPSSGDPTCESGAAAIGTGLALELQTLGPVPSPSCSLKLTVAGEPPVTTTTPIAMGDPMIPETFVTANGTVVLFLRGPTAASTSGLEVHLATFLGALPVSARVAFGNTNGGFGLHSTGQEWPVVTLSTPGSIASLTKMAESWLTAADAETPVSDRLDHALGATAWLVPNEPIEPGFGCFADEHCPPPLVCRGPSGGSARPCGGPSALLAAAPGTTVHVVWVGDPGEPDDESAALDRWQVGGVLTSNHLVVHRVSGSASDCAPADAPLGLVDALRLETGGASVDACDGAAAWETLGAAIADEPGVYRLRYAAAPNSVYWPGNGLLCSVLSWPISPSGRTVRTPTEPDCKEPPGVKFAVDYDALCTP
ncbi:MAG: choice-of-anchor D domain-containing protein [Myxococcales bacterium]|nr:choice-of-anchor D domain-containing protein [Myxococcales bacterium]